MKIDDHIPIKIMPIRELTTYDMSIKTSQNPALMEKTNQSLKYFTVKSLCLGQVTCFMAIDLLTFN